jgi:hypothetical protein
VVEESEGVKMPRTTRCFWSAKAREEWRDGKEMEGGERMQEGKRDGGVYL